MLPSVLAGRGRIGITACAIGAIVYARPVFLPFC